MDYDPKESSADMKTLRSGVSTVVGIAGAMTAFSLTKESQAWAAKIPIFLGVGLAAKACSWALLVAVEGFAQTKTVHCLKDEGFAAAEAKRRSPEDATQSAAELTH